ncbi:MAG: response regulator [Rhodobiaceae bacterium]|nr:response regulator [Rhodobiaceae bacterium]MCC0012949.1 response regulator [Rhodobiaceae bacterium]MCC0051314.1 response regulator [Rhodobiaceae bacterium]MCC0061560.1 response regulator [Rhodobiaceae bacterium]
MPTILVIDDQPNVRQAIETILKRKNFGVFLAGDGKTGLALVEKIRFDAIVVDIFMPEMDGLGTIRHLREIDPAIPIVVVSGHAVTSTRDGKPDFLGMAIRLGATCALQKPFTADELLNALHAAMEETARSIPVGRLSQDCISAPLAVPAAKS